ncbi:MAG TPA: sigma-70 family RNA polymerase sigma factor [Tepidisphaeraceae bacterium]|jgi:RNA polymerase sigma factor (TIGR02999 family)
MSETSSRNVTQLLVAWSKGDQQAFGALMPEVRKELHRLAAHYMAEEPPGHDLQPTALINEAYLRLVDWKNIQWADRAHFFAMAAGMMRRVLVDYARSRDRLKRGGEAILVSFTEAANVRLGESADVLALDKALRELEKIDPRKSQVVEMRFFGGLSQEETAAALNVSVGTVRRDWSLGRAWLARELKKKTE